MKVFLFGVLVFFSGVFQVAYALSVPLSQSYSGSSVLRYGPHLPHLVDALPSVHTLDAHKNVHRFSVTADAPSVPTEGVSPVAGIPHGTMHYLSLSDADALVIDYAYIIYKVGYKDRKGKVHRPWGTKGYEHTTSLKGITGITVHTGEIGTGIRYIVQLDFRYSDGAVRSFGDAEKYALPFTKSKQHFSLDNKALTGVGVWSYGQHVSGIRFYYKSAPAHRVKRQGGGGALGYSRYKEAKAKAKQDSRKALDRKKRYIWDGMEPFPYDEDYVKKQLALKRAREAAKKLDRQKTQIPSPPLANDVKLHQEINEAKAEFPYAEAYAQSYPNDYIRRRTHRVCDVGPLYRDCSGDGGDILMYALGEGAVRVDYDRTVTKYGQEHVSKQSVLMQCTKITAKGYLCNVTGNTDDTALVAYSVKKDYRGLQDEAFMTAANLGVMYVRLKEGQSPSDIRLHLTIDTDYEQSGGYSRSSDLAKSIIVVAGLPSGKRSDTYATNKTAFCGTLSRDKRSPTTTSTPVDVDDYLTLHRDQPTSEALCSNNAPDNVVVVPASLLGLPDGAAVTIRDESGNHTNIALLPEDEQGAVGGESLPQNVRSALSAPQFVEDHSDRINEGQTGQIPFTDRYENPILTNVTTINDQPLLPSNFTERLERITQELSPEARGGLEDAEIERNDVSYGKSFTLSAVRSYIEVTFNQDEWSIDDVYRSGGEAPFHANDMFRELIMRVAQNNWVRYYPRRIILDNVLNDRTLDALNGVEADHISDTFFADTPLGAMTSRILSDIGMEATEVELVHQEPSDTVPHGAENIVVHVQPIDQNARHQ